MEQMLSEPIIPLIEEQVPPQLSEDQMLYQAAFGQIRTFLDKLRNYSGSKKQLQRVFENVALNKLTDDKFTWSYPEEEELFDAFEEVMASKFMFFLMGLEAQGKVTLTPQPQVEKPKENEDV